MTTAGRLSPFRKRGRRTMCDSHQNGTGNGRKPGALSSPGQSLTTRAEPYAFAGNGSEDTDIPTGADRLAGVKLRA